MLQKTTSLSRQLLAFCCGWILCTSEGLSRFLETDADEIDPEERLNTETYNDIISYRYPMLWNRRWQPKDVGFRAHAGSLNINRFHYTEDVKIKAYNGEIPVFGYHRHRREGFLEQRTEQEVRLGGNPFPGFNLAIFADGGTYKQFGDVGFAAGVTGKRRHYFEVYWWSTDHYYDSKKDFDEDHRGRDTETFGTRWQWQWPGLAVRGQFEWDHPLRWYRLSRGYEYEYWRRTGSTQVRLGNPGEVVFVISGEWEDKEEQKTFLNNGVPVGGKGMYRRVSVLEFGVESKRGESWFSRWGNWDAGLVLISRDMWGRFRQLASDSSEENADGNHGGGTLVSHDSDHRSGPSSSRRREAALYFNTQDATGAVDEFYRPLYGVVVNHVRLDEAGGRHVGEEVKWRAALELNLAPEASVLLNTTWDLDELYRDFPYKEAPFRPWGGGDIQFLAVF